MLERKHKFCHCEEAVFWPTRQSQIITCVEVLTLRLLRFARNDTQKTSFLQSKILVERKKMIKENLLYTEEHEWVRIDGNTAIVGITDHAQQMLGEITYVELPEVGREIEVKDEMAVVESSKAASDVYSPVSGKIAEVNTQLETSPELISNDCYNVGWICKIKVAGAQSNENLMDAKRYAEYLKGLE